MELAECQRKELQWLARHAQKPYLRTKALVLLGRADGRAVAELAQILRISRQSVYNWERDYLAAGVEGLRVAPGRGRKARADADQIEFYLRQSPRAFGLRQTRWTLSALVEAVPSLKGFSPWGVQKALARAGFRYKRGQPRQHSPDPQYAAKKGLWTK